MDFYTAASGLPAAAIFVSRTPGLMIMGEKISGKTGSYRKSILILVHGRGTKSHISSVVLSLAEK
jgi:hypothetical protein